jgi:hypothetical protein
LGHKSGSWITLIIKMMYPANVHPYCCRIWTWLLKLADHLTVA